MTERNAIDKFFSVLDSDKELEDIEVREINDGEITLRLEIEPHQYVIVEFYLNNGVDEEMYDDFTIHKTDKTSSKRGGTKVYVGDECRICKEGQYFRFNEDKICAKCEDTLEYEVMENER